MNIYITDTITDQKVQLNKIPDKFGINHGTKWQSYDLLNLSEVKVFNGNTLRSVEWSCDFPGWDRKNARWIHGSWKAPESMQRRFERWCRHGIKLDLLITGTPIHFYVKIEDFKVTYENGFGDIGYSVNFVEYKEILIPTNQDAVSSGGTGAMVGVYRRPSVYVVRSGDNLYKLSNKYLGDGKFWKRIYTKNKKVIEKAAKKHGRKSSGNGRYIYAGTKITIPGGKQT